MKDFVCKKCGYSYYHTKIIMRGTFMFTSKGTPVDELMEDIRGGNIRYCHSCDWKEPKQQPVSAESGGE